MADTSAVSSVNNGTIQCGGNADNAQVYLLRPDANMKYSNTEIIQILQNPDKQKLSHVAPIKPKGGEVYVLDWQGDESKVKDYVADQYVWVADSTNTTNHSGKKLVKKYYNIRDDCGLICSKKLPHSKEFRKTVSYIKR